MTQRSSSDCTLPWRVTPSLGCTCLLTPSKANDRWGAFASKQSMKLHFESDRNEREMRDERWEMRKRDVRFTCFTFLFLQKWRNWCLSTKITQRIYCTIPLEFLLLHLRSRIYFFFFFTFCVFNVIGVAHNLVASDIFIIIFSFIKHE